MIIDSKWWKVASRFSSVRFNVFTNFEIQILNFVFWNQQVELDYGLATASSPLTPVTEHLLIVASRYVVCIANASSDPGTLH